MKIVYVIQLKISKGHMLFQGRTQGEGGEHHKDLSRFRVALCTMGCVHKPIVDQATGKRNKSLWGHTPLFHGLTCEAGRAERGRVWQGFSPSSRWGF